MDIWILIALMGAVAATAVALALRAENRALTSRLAVAKERAELAVAAVDALNLAVIEEAEKSTRLRALLEEPRRVATLVGVARELVARADLDPGQVSAWTVVGEGLWVGTSVQTLLMGDDDSEVVGLPDPEEAVDMITRGGRTMVVFRDYRWALEV
jgi:hypothetical protein